MPPHCPGPIFYGLFMIVVAVVCSATKSVLESSSQMQQHNAILAWPMTGTNLHKNKTQTDDKRMLAEKQSTNIMCLSFHTCRLGSDVLPSQHNRQKANKTTIPAM